MRKTRREIFRSAGTYILLTGTASADTAGDGYEMAEHGWG